MIATHITGSRNTHGWTTSVTAVSTDNGTLSTTAADVIWWTVGPPTLKLRPPKATPYRLPAPRQLAAGAPRYMAPEQPSAVGVRPRMRRPHQRGQGPK